MGRPVKVHRDLRKPGVIRDNVRQTIAAHAKSSPHLRAPFPSVGRDATYTDTWTGPAAPESVRVVIQEFNLSR
jgi:hypothetical protein